MTIEYIIAAKGRQKIRKYSGPYKEIFKVFDSVYMSIPGKYYTVVFYAD